MEFILRFVIILIATATATSSPVSYGGVIACGDRNIFSNSSNVFYDFSNDKAQMVTFSTCSIAFSATLTLMDDNDTVIQSESGFNGCPHLTVNMTEAGDYTFEVSNNGNHVEAMGDAFLLDVVCDEAFVPPHPQTSNPTDKTCNYFVRDDSIVPFDVCFGSSYGFSRKYECLNGEAVHLMYNDTAYCDTVPLAPSEDTDTSNATYYCGATASCPYFQIRYDYMPPNMCSPDMTNGWQSWAQILDLCVVQQFNYRIFTSSYWQFSNEVLYKHLFLGYDCNSNYYYDSVSIRNHDCCFQGQNECEAEGQNGTSYVDVDLSSTATGTDASATTVPSFLVKISVLFLLMLYLV